MHTPPHICVFHIHLCAENGEQVKVTQAANTVEGYSYDPVGNRLSSLSGSYSYNSSNELTSAPSTSYTYDYDGNILTSTTSSNTTSYTWDFENRLTSVTLPNNGGTVSFKYDSFGRRIYKSSSNGTSIYAYDGDNLIEDTNSSGAVVARYAQGLNIEEPLAMLRSSATSFYHADGLGSITSLSNTAGALAQTYTFDSFGKQTSSSGSLTNRFQYTAREFDSETSLYYYRARYYDSGVGRFLNEDPVGFDAGLNFYAYVSNRSLNEVDPFGLASCFYRISTHIVKCWPNNNPQAAVPVVVGPQNVSSGNGNCKDNPDCANSRYRGPIPPGLYKMNPDTRPGQTDRYRLEPQPTIWGPLVTLLIKRGGMELHPGHRTLGCINVLKDDPNAMQQYQQLQKLLDAEQGTNYLLVAP